MAQTVKNLPANAGDPGLILGSKRSPGEGNGNPLQHSCLEHPMARGAWRATVHGVAESGMTERVHFHFPHLHLGIHMGVATFSHDLDLRD